MMVILDNDLANYLLDHYGTCELEEGCYWKPGCLKLGWRGRACPHWKPYGPKDWDELCSMMDASLRRD